MRIIAGRLKGRLLPRVRAGTRPPLARVRQRLMDILAPVVPQSTVLDLCAGTGAFGFEALSRGARSLVLVDEDRRCVQALAAWIEAQGLSGVARALCADWRGGGLPVGPFDLILLDPPFAVWNDEAAWRPGLVSLFPRLAARGWLVVRGPRGFQLGALPGLVLVRRVTTGRSAVEIWGREPGEGSPAGSHQAAAARGR